VCVGFTKYADKFDKEGWISTLPNGSEAISFDFELPKAKCYAVFLGVLRSYKGMGKFTAVVHDLHTEKTTKPKQLDTLWKAHISVWSEDLLTTDDSEHPDCTGKCKVTVTTLPQVDGRDGNKVKILTLSVRPCIEITNPREGWGPGDRSN